MFYKILFLNRKILTNLIVVLGLLMNLIMQGSKVGDVCLGFAFAGGILSLGYSIGDKAQKSEWCTVQKK